MEHQEQKALFTDLDGTLLNDQKEITPGNRAAIDEALSRGHKIIMATGRALDSARPQAESLGLTGKGCYVIAYNGGQIYDMYRRETLYRQSVSLDTVRYVFDRAHEAGLHIQTYGNGHVLTERDTPALHEYCRLTRMDYLLAEDVTAILPAEPSKILAADYQDHHKLEHFRLSLADWAKGKLDMFFSCPEYLEIVKAGTSKGIALRWLCDYLHIPVANSVAAGDAQNDIAMLKAAGIGAVMCNAAPEIQAEGSYVTAADNNHNGVAEIIQRFILN